MARKSVLILQLCRTHACNSAMEVKKSLKIIIKAEINVQWKLDLVKNDLAETREIISLLEIAEYLVLKGKSLVTYLSA